MVQFNGQPVQTTKHMLSQMHSKGFTPEQVIEAFESPRAVTDVTRYPGQKRVCGAGVAVVLKPTRDGWVAVTIYEDMTRTPLRPDQMNDPAALASKRAIKEA